MKIYILSPIFICSSLSSNSEIIKNVDVKNNNRISKETIITYGEIELNKNYEKKDLDKILKRLFDTNFLKIYL